PEGTKVPKCRALGFTPAAGVPIVNIMAQGHWSSLKVFEKHYRLSSVTACKIANATPGCL
ncbi:hypothetical protein EDD21DRAFT_309777, partial [Dissophora ornata]